jgi:thiol-disulfide isomerase/thioredoxin
MNPLKNQEHLETLYRDTTDKTGRRESDGLFFIYFTAQWCQPCKKLDKLAISDMAAKLNVPIYMCDASSNDYSPGYCGVRSFPSFVAMSISKHHSTLTSSSTEKVIQWMCQYE